MATGAGHCTGSSNTPPLILGVQVPICHAHPPLTPSPSPLPPLLHVIILIIVGGVGVVIVVIIIIFINRRSGKSYTSQSPLNKYGNDIDYYRTIVQFRIQSSCRMAKYSVLLRSINPF